MTNEPTTVVYSAIGRGFQWEACLSARSVKAVMPHCRTVLYSDQKVSSPFIDECRPLFPDETIPDSTRKVKVCKIDAILHAASTIAGRLTYLDTDTYVALPFDDLLGASDAFDICLAHDTWRQFAFYGPVAPFNSGVMIFRSGPRLQELLTAWRSAYVHMASTPDQVSFHSVLLASRLRILPLPPEMNARCEEPVHLSGRVRVVHKHYASQGLGTLGNPAVVARFVNQTTDNRVLILAEGRMVALDSSFSLRSLVFEESEELRNVARQWQSVEHEVSAW